MRMRAGMSGCLGRGVDFKNVHALVILHHGSFPEESKYSQWDPDNDTQNGKQPHEPEGLLCAETRGEGAHAGHGRRWFWCLWKGSFVSSSEPPQDAVRSWWNFSIKVCLELLVLFCYLSVWYFCEKFKKEYDKHVFSTKNKEDKQHNFARTIKPS